MPVSGPTIIANTSAASGVRPNTRVFLSYSRRDERFAVWLRERLEAEQIEVFRDLDDTVPGEEWWARLTELISKADSIVFVLSPHSAASKVCADEVAHATGLNKRIFPAVIANVDWQSVPEGLAKVHSVMFKDPAVGEASVAQLVAALMTDLAWVREHSRLGEIAARWHKLGAKDLLLRGRELEAAETWLVTEPSNAQAPNALHRQLVKASRDAARRLRGILMGALLSVLLIVAGFAVWAMIEQRRAVASEKRAIVERDRALVSQSRTLAVQASNTFLAGDADTAALIALEALPPAEDWGARPHVPEAERTLRQALNRNRLVGLEHFTEHGLAIDRDSATVALARSDGTIAVAHPDSRRAQQRLAFDGKALRPLGFDRGGRHLLAATVEAEGGLVTRELSLWDVTTGEPVAWYRSSNGNIASVDLCPGVDRIAIAHEIGPVRLWSPRSGSVVGDIDFGLADGLQITCTDDGRHLLSFGHLKPAMLWRLADGRALRRFAPSSGVGPPRISPDGRRILLTAIGGPPLLLNAGNLDADKGIVSDFSEQEQEIWPTLNDGGWQFSTDSRRLVSVDANNAVRIWDAGTGKLERVLAAHQAAVTGIAVQVLTNGKLRILTGSADGSARLWRSHDVSGPTILTDHTVGLAAVALEPARRMNPRDDFKMLTAAIDGSVIVWKVAVNEEPKRLHLLRTPATAGQLSGARFDTTGDAVIATTADRWLSTWTLLDRLGDGDGLDILAVSPDGKRVAYQERRTIVVRETASSKVHARLEMPQLPRWLRGEFLADGNRLVTYSERGARLTIWDVALRKAVREHEVTGAGISAVAASHDGKRIAVALSEPVIEIIDVETWTVPVTLRPERGRVMALAWSRDQRTLVTAGSAQAIGLWDTESGKPAGAYGTGDFNVHLVALSPDGKRIFALDQEGMLRSWQIAGGATSPPLQLATVPDRTTRLAFHPGGTRLVAGGALIDVVANEILLEAREGDLGLVSPYFTPDGRKTIVLTADGPLGQPFLDQAIDVIRHARAVAHRCLTAAERRDLFLDETPPSWCARAPGAGSGPGKSP